MSAARFRGSYLSYILLFFCSYFGMAAFSAVLSVYLTALGKSAAETSLIVSAGGLFALALTPLTGVLCDRSGRPRLVCGVQLALMGGLAVLFPLGENVWLLFLLNGLIMGMLNATMPVSERLAGAARFRYGALRIWGTLGYALGAQAAGVGFQTSPVLLFTAVGVMGLLAAVGYASVTDPLPRDPLPAEEAAPAPASPRSFLRNRPFLLYLVIAALYASCSFSNMTYTPLLLTDLGVSSAAVGTVLSVSTLVEIPLIFFSHKFMDRFSGKTLLLLTCAANTGEFLVFALVRSALPVIAVILLVKAVSSTLFMMIVLKMVTDLVPPSLASTGMAVVTTANSLGSILFQNLAGPLIDRAGIRAAYLLMAGLTALALALCPLLRVSARGKVFSR